MRSGLWRHECVSCGAIFFGRRCAIACPLCHLAQLDRAGGRCLVCEAKVPFYRHRKNRGPLFCPSCYRARRNASALRSHQARRTGYVPKAHLREEAGIVVGPAVGEET